MLTKLLLFGTTVADRWILETRACERARQTKKKTVTCRTHPHPSLSLLVAGMLLPFMIGSVAFGSHGSFSGDVNTPVAVVFNHLKCIVCSAVAVACFLF